VDGTGLNALEKFAAEAADRDWLAFLEAETPAPRAEPEPIDFDALHGVAKRAFVEEIDAAAGDAKTSAWALSMVDDRVFDLELAKLALALDVETPAVREFVTEKVGTDVDLDDLHGLSKRAFIEELALVLDSDRDLIKETIASVDDQDFDTVLATNILDLEKVAVVGVLSAGLKAGAKGLGRLGSRMGQAMSTGRSALKRGATGLGTRLQASGIRGKKKFIQGHQNVIANRAAGRFGMKPSQFADDYNRARISQAQGRFGPGSLRIGAGKGLRYLARTPVSKVVSDAKRGAGALASRVRGAPTPKPAPPAGGADDLQDLLRSQADELAEAGGKATPPVRKPPDPDDVDIDALEGAKPKAKVDGDAPGGKGDPDVDPGGKTDPDVDAGGDPGRFGTGKGTWDSMNEWFTNATPLQKAIAVGAPALTAEAALD